MAERPPYRIPTLEEIRAVPPSGLTVLSTFTGAGGSCLGFRWAGYRTVAAVEFVAAARDTYRANFPGVPVEERDVRDELRLSVWDSSNSAGVVVDAVRSAVAAVRAGFPDRAGDASAWLMKAPPGGSVSDSDALRAFETTPGNGPMGGGPRRRGGARSRRRRVRDRRRRRRSSRPRRERRGLPGRDGSGPGPGVRAAGPGVPVRRGRRRPLRRHARAVHPRLPRDARRRDGARLPVRPSPRPRRRPRLLARRGPLPGALPRAGSAGAGRRRCRSRCGRRRGRGVSTDLEEVLVAAHNAWKVARGYSEEEILRNLLALEGVLVPVTARWNEDLLREAGFARVEPVWRCLNFAGWLAVARGGDHAATRRTR